MSLALLISVFVVATCGLIYELISGTLASYLLGDSITQFSTIIGVYLFAMGVGSYLSKFVRKNLIGNFVQVELLVGLIGGSSAALLFVVFQEVSSFRIILYLIVFLIGVFVGLEIPLLMRILKDKMEFKDLVSNVLNFALFLCKDIILSNKFKLYLVNLKFLMKNISKIHTKSQ